ncbi:tetratricopeptide repeat protein [Endozoicomonadaceae bacterium StTr2]
MSWTSKLFTVPLVMAVLSIFTLPALGEITSGQHEYYLALRKQMREAPLETLPKIETFQKRLRYQSEQAQLMAASLHLEACMLLQRFSCARQQAASLLSLPLETGHRLTLMELAGQLDFESKAYPQAEIHFRNWLKLADATRQEVKDSPELQQVYASQLNTESFARQYGLMAYSQYYQEHFQQAITSIRKALEYKVSQPYHRLLLSLYQRTEQLKQENLLLQTIINLYPDEKLFWDRLAQTWLELERPDQALATFSSAYKAERLSARSVIPFAQLLLTQGRPARAAAILETNLLAGTREQRQSLLISAYLASFQRQKALKLLNRYSRENPNAVKKQLKLRSQLAYELGRWQQAAGLLQKQSRLEPGNDYWKLLLAVCLYELDQMQASRAAFQQLQQGKYKTTAVQWIQQIDFLVADTSSQDKSK